MEKGEDPFLFSTALQSDTIDFHLSDKIFLVLFPRNRILMTYPKQLKFDKVIGQVTDLRM